MGFLTQVTDKAFEQINDVRLLKKMSMSDAKIMVRDFSKKTLENNEDFLPNGKYYQDEQEAVKQVISNVKSWVSSEPPKDEIKEMAKKHRIIK